MKVAVLYYGQPRYLDNPRPEEAYNRELFSKYNCDTFFHTWYGRDVREYEVSTWVASSIQPDPNAVSKIIDKFAPTVLKVETPREFKIPENVKEHITKNFTYNELNVRNIFSHLYSISEVSKLALQYQWEMDMQYDWFVLARTDMIIRNVPDLWKVDKNKLYLPNNHSNFPDTVVAFGAKFLPWAATLYDTSHLVVSGIQEPTAESFKMQTFALTHSPEDLVPCSIYGDVVRNNR